MMHAQERSRRQAAADHAGGSVRPSVSVCMAAYKGERYIEAQLRSIVSQLRRDDEIVIVEDASPDGTAAKIEDVRESLATNSQAPQIILVRHAVNRGVVQTFEDALRSASGEVLFLCDDDDLWAPDKVEKVLRVFADDPETVLVSTGLSLIDEAGAPLADGDFLKHRRFRPGFVANVLRNQFQGSAMAFRGSLLSDILPFPKGRTFLHDVWIGTRAALAGRKAVFLNEPLLLYRRHGNNYSRRMSPVRQLRLRLELLAAHLLFLLRRL